MGKLPTTEQWLNNLRSTNSNPRPLSSYHWFPCWSLTGDQAACQSRIPHPAAETHASALLLVVPGFLKIIIRDEKSNAKEAGEEKLKQRDERKRRGRPCR